MKRWARRDLAEWLATELDDGPPTIVGLDHAFSFPRQYFERYGLARDWDAFLEDFQRHWPTDEDTHVAKVREGVQGAAKDRIGETKWRRLTEICARSAKSVFHFGVNGEVATSTHAGLPWLRFVRKRVGHRVHFWPFDGWEVPVGRSAVVEVYPRLWSGNFFRGERTGDQHDAYSVAATLRKSDVDGSLSALFAPTLTPDERTVASYEGWILGVK
jgi:hypothetical protein